MGFQLMHDMYMILNSRSLFETNAKVMIDLCYPYIIVDYLSTVILYIP